MISECRLNFSECKAGISGFKREVSLKYIPVFRRAAMNKKRASLRLIETNRFDLLSVQVTRRELNLIEARIKSGKKNILSRTSHDSDTRKFSWRFLVCLSVISRRKWFKMQTWRDVKRWLEKRVIAYLISWHSTNRKIITEIDNIVMCWGNVNGNTVSVDSRLKSKAKVC